MLETLEFKNYTLDYVRERERDRERSGPEIVLQKSCFSRMP